MASSVGLALASVQSYRNRQVVATGEMMVVMELVVGGGLDKYLKKQPATPFHVRNFFVFDLARGLAYLHAKRVIHRSVARGVR